MNTDLPQPAADARENPQTSHGSARGGARDEEGKAPPVRETVREMVREIGGRKDGTEPTRFGDWEKGGRCIDF